MKETYQEIIELCERQIKNIQELPRGLVKGSSNFHFGKIAAYKEIIDALQRKIDA